MCFKLMYYETTFERTNGVVMTVHIMLPLVTGISQHERQVCFMVTSFQSI
jgi:hypothetical protein